ncbi:MAG: glycosyl hydrolase-related protein, partial [Clostridiales bacterium]|jgi:alpha-mannosidase|nr:glycosyl hydrolase-related protein [Clostridiales bacterium]
MHTDWVINRVKERIAQAAPETPLSAAWITSEEVMPRRNVLEGLIGLAESCEGATVAFGTLKSYFDKLDALVASGEIELPRYAGEFNPLFTGCYTTRSDIKRRNTRLQNRLLSMEALMCCLPAEARAGGREGASLEPVWRELLLNQFHDAMCGCVSASAFFEIMGRFDAAEAQLDALCAPLLPQETAAERRVFNPLPYRRGGLVALAGAAGAAGIWGADVAADWGAGAAGATGAAGTGDGGAAGAVSHNGEPLPQVALDGTLYALLPDVAALDTAALTVRSGVQAPKPERTETDSIENGLCRIRLQDGANLRLESLRAGGLCLEGPVGGLIVREDKGGFWTAQPTGRVKPADSVTEQFVEAGGPLQRAITRGALRGTDWNPDVSCLWEREIRLWQGEDRVDFLYRIDWTGSGCDLSAVIPTPFESDRACYETPFAVWPRPVYEPRCQPFSENRGGEWPSLRFVSAGDGNFGVSVVHEGLHGIRWDGREFVINLLHTPDESNLECGAICWDLAPVDGVIHEPTAHERGTHRFAFSLRLHRGDWRTGHILRLTETLHHPLLEVGAAATAATAPGLDLSELPDSVGFSALKPAEDGDGMILRLWEGGGEEAACAIRYPGCEDAWLCGLNEERLSRLERAGDGFAVTLRPYEILSARFCP